MKRTVLFVLFVLAALNVAAQDADLKKEALLVRALHAMGFVSSFKQGLLSEKQSTGKATNFMDATLAADDARLEAVIARVYARHLTRRQAEELARFYESAAGKAMVAQQARDLSNPRPRMTLEPAQAKQVRAFISSPTGKAFAGISDSEDIWVEVVEAIRKALPK